MYTSIGKVLNSVAMLPILFTTVLILGFLSNITCPITLLKGIASGRRLRCAKCPEIRNEKYY